MFWPPGGAGVGDCDNGLGFEKTTGGGPVYIESDGGAPILIGYDAWGQSTGTLYAKRAGGESITISCSPSAYAAGEGDMFVAGVWYGVKIIVPKVALAGATRFYDPHALKFLTGQQISASVTVASGPGPLEIEGLEISPTSYLWSIPGNEGEAGAMAFKNFVVTSTNGYRQELSAYYKSQPTFSFFTVDEATFQVECAFSILVPEDSRFAGDPPDVSFMAKSWDVDSVRPQFVKWDVKDGTVTLQTDRFVFGADADSTDGQQWLNVEYYVPGGFGQVGEGAFCQLINADRHLHRTVTNPTAYTHFIKDPWNALQTVDIGLPYPFHGIWSLPNKGVGEDSPSQPLAYAAPFTYMWYHSNASDSFETWAMYRPPSKDGQPITWIPIARYTWAWQGTATFGANGWAFTGTSGGLTSAPVDSLTHPWWDKVTPFNFGFIGIP